MKNWRGIALYAVLATLISGLFRSPFFDFYNNDNFHFLAAFACVTILIGWGPAIAAVFSWKMFGAQGRSSTLFGAWKGGALIMALAPLVVFGAFGYPNDFGMNAHLAGGILGGLIFLYALGEEIGWRGYMHDALAPKSIWMRAILIGSVWWTWHLFFLTSLEPNYILLTLAIIIPTAFIFSWVISESRSWISAAAFHSVGNIAFMATAINMPQTDRFTVAGTVFGILLTVHHFWKRRISAEIAINS
ncbi:CPBP family glutamic-type intramembrane protease [Sphingorhabdus sp. Alg239-R122]|uniref:CPBP family glutamic-type intramembrane protease n=1 Tax=Sphingorhabdus sp. Alg239-R122 TaxID=2305989 RepID=UPI0013DBD4EF|nr:CPBP family glutamic-type intramembrane protease [Sphingorhabdus sp. Alg239-R122]